MRTAKNSIEMRGWNHVQEIQSSVQALAALIFSFSHMSSKYRDKFDMLLQNIYKQTDINGIQSQKLK